MTLPDIHAAQEPEALFGDIVTYLDEAEALVDAGDTATLAGFDMVVEALCTRVTQLDEAAAREYTDELEYLVSRLDGLKGKMLALRGDLSGALKSLDAQKKANRTYSMNNSKPEGQ